MVSSAMSPGPKSKEASSKKEFKVQKFKNLPLSSGVVIQTEKGLLKSPMKVDQRRDDDLEVNQNFGKIPEYILDLNVKRKVEQHKNQLIKYLMEAVPPGKRPVHEDERQAILSDLREVQVYLKQAIDTFPIHRLNVNRSNLIYRQKEELESKLYKVTNAIEFYSKLPVFVPLVQPIFN